MNRTHDCVDLRDQMFNYRRGELSELDAAFFEENLDRCPSCGRHIERLMGMLDSAAEMEAEAWLGAPLDDQFADDLFASIVGQIESEDVLDEGFADFDDDLALFEALAEAQPEPPEEVAERVRLAVSDTGERPGIPGVYLEQMWSATEHAQDDEELDAPPRRSGLFLVVAAVALVACGAAWFATRGQQTTLPEAPIAHRDTPQTTPNVTPEPEAKPQDAQAAAFAALERQPSTPRSIRVFASPGAEWALSGERKYTLRLDRGTVLVEFLPGRGEKLEVVSGERRVAVIGTVFYVSSPKEEANGATRQPARVGVLTGKVRVRDRDQKKTLELGAGQEVSAERRVKSIRKNTFERATKLVDLERHELMLQRIKEAKEDAHPAEAKPAITARTQVKRPRAVAKARPRRPDLGALRLDARRSLKDRDYRKTASNYERMLKMLPEDHAESATLRLELARIYMRHLNRRDDAIGHLRTFIKHHPSDVAAPSARRQLCRLLGADAAQEPSCSTQP